MRTAIIVILALLVVSCQPAVTQLTAKDLRKGPEGVILSFVKEAPPDLTYDNSDLPIIIEAHNKGAYDTANGVLLINTEEEYVALRDEARIDDRATQLTYKTVPLILKGKNLEDEPGPGGEFKTYQFMADVGSITLSKVQNSNVKAIACYDYQTVADESVCTASRANRYSFTGSPCTPKDIILSDQGAPVAVTKIEVSTKYTSDYESQNVFKIFIKNKGKGRIFKTGNTYRVCSPHASDDRRVWDIVQVYAELGGKELDCDNENMVRLSEERDYIICKGNLDDSRPAPRDQIKPTNPEYFGEQERLDPTRKVPMGSYYSPIYIQLSYGYLETISKTVRVERNI